MDAFLLIVAWGAGIASLFLIADMIAADFANRRAERIAARHGDHPKDCERRSRQGQ